MSIYFARFHPTTKVVGFPARKARKKKDSEKGYLERKRLFREKKSIV